MAFESIRAYVWNVWRVHVFVYFLCYETVSFFTVFLFFWEIWSLLGVDSRFHLFGPKRRQFQFDFLSALVWIDWKKNTNQRKTERMEEWKKWINQDDLYIVTPFLSEMKGTMTTTATTTRCLCVEHILLYAEHDQQSKVILYPKVCPAFAIHISHTIHWPIHGNKLFYSLRSLPRVRWVIFFFLFFFLSYPYCFRLNTLFSACFVHFHSHFFVSLFSMCACSLSLSHFPMVFHN